MKLYTGFLCIQKPPLMKYISIEGGKLGWSVGPCHTLTHSYQDNRFHRHGDHLTVRNRDIKRVDLICVNLEVNSFASI
jgi:hypothetical protein